MSRFVALTAAASLLAAASAQTQCTPLGEAAANAGLTSLVDAVDVVKEESGAAALLAAVSATEPLATPITLFAPNNAAFESISDVVEGLTPAEVLSVLSNHVVASKLNAASVTAAIEAASPNPAKVTTLAATTLEATSDADGILVTPQDTDIMARVVVADVETCAGVVHVIDKVLVPAALDTAEEDADKFVVWTAYAGKDYSPKEDNAAMVEDIPGGAKVVGDQQECEEFCDATEHCNAASFYSELVGGNNCWLKTVAEACALPSDAAADEKATLLLKCDKCTPLGEAATAAGLTSLVGAVDGVKDLAGATPLLAAVGATEPVAEPITLFAPNNAAFEAISDVVAGLTPEQVLEVLANHVVASELTAGEATEAITAAAPNPVGLESLAGKTLQASLLTKDILIAPKNTDIMAMVVVADVQTCAGVVHVIDAVLVPGDEEEVEVSAGAPASAPMSAGDECTPLGEAATAAGLTSLVGAVDGVKDLAGASTLMAAVGATEPAAQPITLFAPNNAAFAAISDVVAGLSAEEVLAVLSNHVVGSELDAAAVTAAIDGASPNPAEVTTLAGAILEATSTTQGIELSPKGTDIMSLVVMADVETCAGVVHIIDEVLVPAADTTTTRAAVASTTSNTPVVPAADSTSGAAGVSGMAVAVAVAVVASVAMF